MSSQERPARAHWEGSEDSGQDHTWPDASKAEFPPLGQERPLPPPPPRDIEADCKEASPQGVAIPREESLLSPSLPLTPL